MTDSLVTKYVAEDGTAVSFETEPTDEFVRAGAKEIAGTVQDAVRPAIAAATTLVNSVRGIYPDKIEVKFGIKVTGSANWIVAKAATEAHFEVTLSWCRESASQSTQAAA